MVLLAQKLPNLCDRTSAERLGESLNVGRSDYTHCIGPDQLGLAALESMQYIRTF
jgi:hypothetical protein